MTEPDLPLRVSDLQVQGANGPLAARLYRAGAERTASNPLILFFHGGCFISGDVRDTDPFLRQLAVVNHRYAILSVNYTLAPAGPFPAAVEDAYAVLLWAKKNKAKLGWNGQQLVVAGIEAGANIAAVSAMMARDRHGPVLAGQILITPMLDAGLTSCSMRELAASAVLSDVAEGCALGYRKYLPHAADRDHPYASPLQSSRLKNLPPTLIISAQEDPLRDEAEQYGNKLTACDVRTTVKRVQNSALVTARASNACACEAGVQAEIAAFVDTLLA
jgi:acetyl esterase/lipase